MHYFKLQKLEFKKFIDDIAIVIFIFNFFNGLNLWFVKRTKRNLEGKMNLRYLIGHLVLLSANKNYIN